jgi:hypothetical protein
VSRRGWIITLIAAGVGLAVLVGVLGTRNEPSTSKASSVSSLCASLTTLEGSLKALTSIDPSTVTAAELQADVNAVQTDWTQVQSDVQAVQNAPAGELESAWSAFESAVKNIGSASSASDAANGVKQAATQLDSAAQSTAAAVSC